MGFFRKNFISLTAAFLALGLLFGCDHLSEEELNQSGSKLQITSVTPTALTADVSPDPNTMAPPPDDQVTVGLTNTAQAGSGGDILVMSYDVTCTNGTLDATAQPAAVPVAAGGTASVDVTVATGAYKQANSGALLAIGGDICAISFHGENLNGDPVNSQDVLIGVTFADVP